MARAYASAIIDAPVELAWATIRDFGALASWLPAVTESGIEGGADPDSVGCIRFLRLDNGTPVRERLLMLDDSRYSFSYNFETPAFPVENYVATVELIPVTNGNSTFARWWATFDERPEDKGTYVDIISNAVFAAGWRALGERLKGAAHSGDDGQRWQGFRPAKVFCSSVIPASAERVWRVVRDFAGMGGWHPEITDMHMLGSVRSDKVSGTRRFRFGEGKLEEQLTFLSDADRSFRYRITESDQPWQNYHAALTVHDVTASGACCGGLDRGLDRARRRTICDLIPFVHTEVFQKAFDTLAAQLPKRRGMTEPRQGRSIRRSATSPEAGCCR